MNPMLAPLLLLLVQEAVPTRPTKEPDPPAQAPKARILTLDGRSIEGTNLRVTGGRLAVELSPGEAAVEFADVLEASVEAPVPANAAHIPGSAAAPAVEVEFVNRDLLRGVLLRGKGEEESRQDESAPHLAT